MIAGINDFKSVFFIGVAGTGMSALAQWLAGAGKQVSGSDRYFLPNSANETRDKLEAAGVRCFLQIGEGITDQTDLIVVSTAIEDTVPEVQKAKQLGIPIVHRAAMLSLIAKSKRTIAVGGTSGKSTTSAMLFDILQEAGMDPGIISGAGLVSIIRQNKIGNAWVGKGEWLVIEADESDGSIVQYAPEIGLLLNVDKDHKEMDVLMDIFRQFKANTKGRFIVNRGQSASASLSANAADDFSIHPDDGAGFVATDFKQSGLEIQFTIRGEAFRLHTVGRHNMENALAAVSVAVSLGVSLKTCAAALSKYQGIYRRHQVIGEKNGVMLIDDYAHNPVKCAVSIQACQELAPKVIAWFQPHGYGPTKFLRHDFVQEIAKVLRPADELWMSEIFYAGGTAVKDISAGDLIADLQALGKPAFFEPDRTQLVKALRSHLQAPCVLLLMGARDPSLEVFAGEVWGSLKV